MGETCGLKMVNAIIPEKRDCRICEAISTKQRRLKKAMEDYLRFRPDSQRQATARVRYQEILDLQGVIETLQDDRVARWNNVGNGRTNASPRAMFPARGPDRS